MKALAVTATLVLLLLSLGVAVLAMLPPPGAGDYSVIIEVTPQGSGGEQTPAAAPDGRQSNNAAPGTDPNVDAPAGVAVTGLNPELKALMATDGQSPAPSPAAGTGRLPPAPVSDLIEQSEYGPLPKVAADGRRPADIYARPASSGAQPRVAILVEGLSKADAIAQAIELLPPEVSIGLSPYGQGQQEWVDLARSNGHEVLLQIPLEPPDYPNNDPGPHTLLSSLGPDENMKRLHWLMSRFTGYVGVTNYMGGKFQADDATLRPFLTELKQRGLLYLEDGTVENPKAPRVAKEVALPYALAQVQLGGDQPPDAVRKALEALEQVAREDGVAVAVAWGGPPETMQAIKSWAATLQQKGLVLVPVSAAASSQS